MDKDLQKKEAFWKVEVSGQDDRVRRLNAKRNKQRIEFDATKTRIAEANAINVTHIQEKFASKTSNVEQIFTEVTTGLVSREEYAERRSLLEKLAQEEVARQEAEIREPTKERKRNQSAQRSVLSFGDDLQEEDECEEGLDESKAKIPKLGKDPTVNTLFLRDKKREEAEEHLREELKEEWLAKQEKVKLETIKITYSYWDGRGNRRSVSVQKGWTISRFLQEVQKEFKELARQSTDNILYIKEDLIIPQNMTFYDLIITQARGKSGPLFKFDVRDDIRLQNDAAVEKIDTHAGKVVDRKWYERNRHVFPASRWEMFDPKKDYGTYTVAGPGKEK